MWSPDRRLFLTGLTALAGCGFTPVYGPQGSGARLLNRIAFDSQNSRESYLLTRRLEERLGRADNPPFRLGYDIKVTTERMAILSDNTTARFNLVGAVDYRLTDVASNAVTLAGRVSSFTGYSATGTTVATMAAQRDAQERLMTILADLLTTRLIAESDRIAQ